MKSILLSFKQSEFNKNVLTLLTGTTVSQALPILISPILTRFYSPEDFGLVALFLSIVSVFSIVASLQYENAILLPEQDEDAVNIVGLCLFLAIIMTFVSVIAVVFFNGLLCELLGSNQISTWLYFVPIMVFLTGVYNVFNFYNLRKKKYKRLAIRQVASSSSTSVLKLALGFLGYIKSGLIMGTIIGQSISTLVLMALTLKEDKNKMLRINKETVKINAKRYQDFPKYTALHSLFDVFKNSSLFVLVTQFFSAFTLGLFSFAIGMLQKPMSIIGSSVNQVFFQEASFAYANNQDLWPITKKALLKLLVIAVPMFSIIILFGPWLFEFVFGEKWREAGVYAQLMSPWLMANFISSPISSIPSILNKQRNYMLIGVVFNLLLPGTFFVFATFSGSFNLSLLGMSILASLYLFGNIIWMYRLIKNQN